MSRKKQASKSRIQKARIPIFISVVINLVVASLFVFLINKLVGEKTPYKWVKERYLDGNMGFINQYPNITKHQKLSNKLKATYNYCDFINSTTPDTAVILLPFDTLQIADKNFKLKGFNQIKGRIMNKKFMSYLLHPRKVVLLSEIQKKEFSLDNIEYLAIIDGHGYNLLPNNKNTSIENTILKVRK
jgi:hypothetical protein